MDFVGFYNTVISWVVFNMSAFTLRIESRTNLLSGCRIGKQYPKECKQGVPCCPIEGSFITQCEKCDKY